MTMGRERKLLWAFTLILVASTAVFLFAFTFRPTLVSAQSTLAGDCKLNKTTQIFQCKETFPEKERGVKIPETCVKGCLDALGFPARFGNAQDLFCVEAKKNLTCGDGTVIPVAQESANPIDATQKQLKEREDANKKDCSGFLDVGCWVNKLLNTVTDVVTGILDLLIAPIAGAVKLLAGAVARLMGAAITYLSGMTVSPGISTTPPFVTTGWNFTRSLANNFFILILAFIGLATILRLQAYQLQKTLPALRCAPRKGLWAGCF